MCPPARATHVTDAGYQVRGAAGQYRIEFDAEAQQLRSYFSEKGRGLELSELQVFDGADVEWPRPL